jgi:uncharacterized protein (DUF433 family)
VVKYLQEGEQVMMQLTRITRDPAVMGGKPCIRGMRVTVGTIVGLLASGHSEDAILKAYPYLEKEDVREALAYAAWRAEEFELPLIENAPFETDPFDTTTPHPLVGR